jgi:ankyrin repeat protein
VVSACQSNEVSKLDALLQESPLRKLDNPGCDNDNHNNNNNEDDNHDHDHDENCNNNMTSNNRSLTTPHLEFLLPNSIAKNRSQLERGKEARQRLANYVLTTDVPIAFSPLRTGRTALHTACFHGDLPFMQLVLEKLATYEDTDSLLPESYLNITCDDSGWAPIHYAALSGSTEMLEVLLAGGCDVNVITDDTHTWRER